MDCEERAILGTPAGRPGLPGCFWVRSYSSVVFEETKMYMCVLLLVEVESQGAVMVEVCGNSGGVTNAECGAWGTMVEGGRGVTMV